MKKEEFERVDMRIPDYENTWSEISRSNSLCFKINHTCKCQYKNVAFISYKNVGKPTRLYDIFI